MRRQLAPLTRCPHAPRVDVCRARGAAGTKPHGARDGSASWRQRRCPGRRLRLMRLGALVLRRSQSVVALRCVGREEPPLGARRRLVRCGCSWLGDSRSQRAERVNLRAGLERGRDRDYDMPMSGRADQNALGGRESASRHCRHPRRGWQALPASRLVLAVDRANLGQMAFPAISA